jgi:hypothetical protein
MWAVAAVTAATTTYSAVSQNQQAQHAKGAAQAMQTAANAEALKTGPVQKTGATPSGNDQATAAAQARKAAAMRAGIMSTIGPGLGSIGNTTPNMPAAYATGMKTALGQ